MSLPINTNKMVFYGRAITTPSTETDYKSIFGHLDDTDGYGVAANLANTSFHLGKRLNADDKVKLEELERLLSSILTCIMETSRGTSDATYDGYNLNNYMLNMKWSAYNTLDDPDDAKRGKSPAADFTDDDLTQLEYKLAKAYKEMTTIHWEAPTTPGGQGGELRNGSMPALLAMVTDLWTIVNGVRCAKATSKAEALAKLMATEIHTELKKYFNGTYSEDGGPVTGVSILNISVLIEKLVADSYWPGTTQPTATDFSHISGYPTTELAVFPAKFNLPQGATHLRFNKTGNVDEAMPNWVPANGFYYAVNFNSSAAGSGTFTVDDYYYPAELLYFGNSPLRVSDASYKPTEYPTTTATWDNTGDNTFWKTAKDGKYWTLGGRVKTSTRSVAMANDINYGTALLETTVGYASGIGPTKPLQDNNKYIQNRDYDVIEDNNTIVPTDVSFSIEGILIGGQYPRVGWNFLPALKPASGTTPAERQGYIYDNQIASSAIPASSNSAPNYTLVFDNLNYNPLNGEVDGTQHTVYVALELKNNTGAGFFGKDNLIPNGSNFYLIGALNPSSGTGTLTSPKHHALPPYNTDGPVRRVFIQDHKTVVNLKIGEFSLQYAYLNIPDLRSSSVTLGLSVDMQWSEGLTFDDVVVGGTSDQGTSVTH